MAFLVVDASALVVLLLADEAGRQVSSMLAAGSAAAPAHVDAEVLSALGRLVRSGKVPERYVESASDALAQAPIDRFPLGGLLHAAWTLRRNVALKDALYVVLARALGAALITTDARLSRAPDLGVPVVLVGG